MNLRSSGVLAATALAVALASGCASIGGAANARSVVPTSPATQPVSVSSAPASATPSSTPTSAKVDDTFVMPNEVGKVLQTAQDDIQRVSGNPLFFTHSSDATGQGRHQILDRDWQVCSQNVKAGTRVGPDVDITFAVVKIYENCP